MWLDLIKVGLSEIKDLFNRQEKKKEKSYAAIETIYKAANDTSVFIAQCSRKTEKPNQELSDIWVKAASKVRDLDSDLYNRLLVKSEYWANPEVWTQQDISQYNISLESIKKHCKSIIETK
jgi:hypothetical protein